MADAEELGAGTIGIGLPTVNSKERGAPESSLKMHGLGQVTIAVSIPVFNGEDFIARCLESVWAQTRSPDEIIVVDDGSTDRTPELLAKAGNRIKVHRTKNYGLAAARNAGFSLAQSAYVAFLDADDYWPPNKLEVYERYVRRFREAGLFYSDSYCIGSGNVYRRLHAGSPGKNTLFRLLKNSFVASSSAMVKRDVWKEVGGVRGEFAHPAGVVDWDFFLKVSKVTQFQYIPEPLLFYRVHPTSAMQTRQDALWKDSVRVVLEHSRHVPKTEMKAALASVFYQSGLRFLTVGALPKARDHFARSFRFSFRALPSLVLFVISLAGPRAIAGLLTLRRTLLRLFVPASTREISGREGQ